MMNRKTLVLFIYLFDKLFDKSMSQSRPQNSLSNEHEEDVNSQNEVSQQSQHNQNRASTKPPGRAKGRGRPKLSQRAMNKKKTSEEEFQQELPKTKQKANSIKEQNQIEAYVRIIDFLKKIQCDQASFQNKMNPFHSLTASGFWYMVSGEYFSYDFFIRNNPSDSANHVLNRVGKLPISMVTRFIKNTHQGALLQFQTQEVKNYGVQMSNHLAHLIPNPFPSPKFENIQKKLSLTSVTEDNQFVSSTRAIIFNYIKGKIQKSDKWASVLKGRLQILNDLKPKEITRRRPITFQQNNQIIVDASQLDILSRQLKIKKSQKKKGQKGSQPVIEVNIEAEQNQGNQDSGNIKSLNQKIQENVNVEQCEMSNQKNEMQVEKLQNHDMIRQKESQNDQIQNDRKSSIDEQNESLSQIQIRTAMKQMSSDQVLLSSILNLPLQKVISLLELSLPQIELPSISPTFMPIPKADPLDFVFQLHEEQQNYLEYMKQYQKKVYHNKVKGGEKTFQEQERQTQFEDAKCQICTDGDYTDDNLIVFCSTCNISLHQRCVGLAKVPAQSWVCDVCAAFGPAGINVPCPLCNVKGGAMKRTNIHIDSNLFKETNPGYYQYAKKCPYNKQKQEYSHPLKMQLQNVEKDEKQQKQELYYDYFNKTTYPNDQPLCHYVWVHYVCSIWVPQCYFQQKNGAINVKGIQNIQKKRFKHQCYVCKKVRAGACVKCQQPECRKFYHPQCARKKRVYMEQLNLQKIKYLVFCQQHQPLKITRQIEYKKKKNRDEIIKFARMIEKYVETYKIAYFPFKLMKIIPTKSFIQTFEHEEKQQEPQKKPCVIKQTDEDFIKDIIIKLSKVKKISITIVKTQTGIKIVDTHLPSRRQMRKCLNKYDDFWHTIQNGETADQNCKRYDRIMKQNFFLKDKMEIFLNGGSLAGSIKPAGNGGKNKKGRARGRSAKQQVQTHIQEEGGIFCICRKPYQNELDMIECDVCGQWYHYKCIGFIGNQADAQTLQFHCMKCMLYQTEQQKRPRLEKCIHLFSSDSLYLNYSPPTPKLMSEQGDNEEHGQFNLEVKEQIPENNHKHQQKGKNSFVQAYNQSYDQQSENKSKSAQEKSAQNNLPSVLLKGGKQSLKSQKSDVSIKQVQKTKPSFNSPHVNNLSAGQKIVQPSKAEVYKMQTTITSFLGSKIKKDKESLKQDKNNNSLTTRQKLAQLERSVLQGEYNSTKK